MKKYWSYFVQNFSTYTRVYTVHIFLFQPKLSDYLWDGIWLGANDIEKEGFNYWESSGKPVLFSKWSTPRNPDKKRSVENKTESPSDREDCVQMFRTSFWNDLPCEKLQYVVCEKIGSWCESTSTTTTITSATTTITISTSTSSSLITGRGKYDFKEMVKKARFLYLLF